MLKQTDVSAGQNNRTYVDFYDRLRMLATSIFTWKNLDDHFGYGASRFLEQTLFDNGRACFVNDPEIGLKALKVNPSDRLNVYGLPIKVQAFSFGYEKQFDFDDVVYVMNNELQMATANPIQLIAYRLYETERTIDTNLIAQKTPILIEGDTKTILTLKQVYQQYSGNNPFIFGNKQFDISNKLNVLKTDAPYLVDKLTDHKKDLIVEALNILGIDNFFSPKKERLVAGEVSRTEDVTNFYLNCFYKTRKEACDLLNEKFLQGKKPVELTINKEEILKLKGELDDIMESREVEITKGGDNE